MFTLQLQYLLFHHFLLLKKHLKRCLRLFDLILFLRKIHFLLSLLHLQHIISANRIILYKKKNKEREKYENSFF